MRIPLLPCASTIIVLLTIGCGGPQKAPVEASTVDVRTSLRVLDGRTGEKLRWDAFMARLRGADVVVLGEQHDDATGHAVQLAVVEDLLDQSPGSGGVALEMLERDEQVLLEDYRDKIIDAETFATLSGSASWSGWKVWYQPVIDAAIERGAAVIAANAPRRYVRLARTGGWERLDDLDATRRQLVDRPDTPMTGAYRDRFMELMGGHDDPAAGGEDDTQAQADALELVESYFRSQQVWDATMAASVSEALRQSGPPVMLLVGRFHSDRGGGTTLQIKRLHPAARVVTISLEPACGEVEFDEAMPQADFVVCTGP